MSENIFIEGDSEEACEICTQIYGYMYSEYAHNHARPFGMAMLEWAYLDQAGDITAFGNKKLENIQ